MVENNYTGPVGRLNLPIFGSFLFLAIVLTFADSRALLDPLKDGLQIVVVPAERIIFGVRSGVGEVYSLGKFWKSGEERIKNLEERNRELASQASRTRQLEAENGELRGQLGGASLPERRRLPAAVLGRGRYLALGEGSRSGVRVGQTVVYKDSLVGRIVDVSPRTSFVELPIDPGVKVPVKLNNSGRARGITVGQFNSEVLLDQVAQNEQLDEGDFVLTTGEEQVYVPDLIVGRVGKILSAKTEIFARAEVDPLVHYDDLTTVFVLLD